MSMTDPIADLITRIRNGQRANKSSVSTPASRLRGAVLDVLESEGYIRGYTKG
jgi:small subunit ribosomal protein S8